MPATTVPVACCSFCHKPSTAVEALLSGPGVHICSACVGRCAEVLAARAGGGETPSFPGNEPLAAEEVLGMLPSVAAAVAQAELNLAAWVRRARSLEVTWARIGQTLGMTRQSAWERFSGEQ